MAFASSGTAATVTAGAGAVVAIAASVINAKGGTFRNGRLINEGAGAGFVSFDKGLTWDRFSAAASATAPFILESKLATGISEVQIKRDTVTDLAGVYVSIWG